MEDLYMKVRHEQWKRHPLVSVSKLSTAAAPGEAFRVVDKEIFSTHYLLRDLLEDSMGINS